MYKAERILQAISILAPSRERLHPYVTPPRLLLFQSSLPHGSDLEEVATASLPQISILAPSRERQLTAYYLLLCGKFQSSLPHGSDSIKTNYFSIHLNQAFFAN